MSSPVGFGSTLIRALLDQFGDWAANSGPGLVDKGTLRSLVNQLFSYSNGLTAQAGGTQAAALRLVSTINEVSTVATAADSVALPIAYPGSAIFLINDGANSMQVFGAPSNPSNGGAGDTIAAHNSVAQTATATGVPQASAAVAVYVCFALGKWKQFLTA